jgi:hypothetical protein
MKTRNITPTILLALLMSSFSFAENFTMQPEQYVDDIPFNTTAIAKEHMLEINTEKEYPLSQEAYVDDIPFDTFVVVAASQADSAMQVHFELAVEQPVDDFPFDTYEILKEHQARFLQAGAAYNRLLVFL